MGSPPVGGSTGEPTSQTVAERIEVMRAAARAIDGRAPFLPGTGTARMDETLELTAEAQRLGAAAALVVTPYYGRAQQQGLFDWYSRVAREFPDLPIILYNVPGRTSCNLEPATVARLAGIDNIVAIKEASGNIGQIAELAALVDDSFDILAGDDSVVLPVAALGGTGVVSVASNLLPERVSALCHAAVEGRYAEARALNRELMPIFKVMFIESNPIPIKAAMAMAGMIEEVYRLPLVPLAEANRARLRQSLVEAGIVVEPSQRVGA